MASHPYKRVHNSNGHPIGEHIAIAQAAIGKELPEGAQVHHFNYDKRDNRPENLVICPDAAYHKLIHLRTDALEATGNPEYRRCVHCGEWDAPENLTQMKTRATCYHKACNNKQAIEYRRRV